MIASATADDAPETRSELMFADLGPEFGEFDPATGNKRGLRSAIAAVRKWRRDKRNRAALDDLAA